MTDIIYRVGDEGMLDEIRSLWEALNHHHYQVSDNFKAHFGSFTFEARKRVLHQKAKSGRLHLVLAVDRANMRTVGFCISRVEFSGHGEVESLYVLEDYRRGGLGDALMRNALTWMDEMGAHTKTVAVAIGNETTFRFYERFGFYPRKTMLEKID